MYQYTCIRSFVTPDISVNRPKYILLSHSDCIAIVLTFNVCVYDLLYLLNTTPDSRHFVCRKVKIIHSERKGAVLEVFVCQQSNGVG